ncbi:hypothetical protein PMZ80_010136 [Knufia obscura]|uniref:NAD(P)-binding protein n=2 Tax=Knufia TaxID=430999 RepID=A0AAN8ESV8_9EURO|nr:hypothetical protein PMZ80_010136 [Knufia obscura]KAK5952876.1 hypothetical protein OHC33_005997 [Knufia fluminis]
MTLRALVVGGTSGIGYAMACRLAAETHSATVTISGRTKPQNLPPNITFRPLEATSMRQIKAYTDTLKATLPPSQKLDYLIMTQGIMSTAPRTETPEGIDRKMALHFYGKQHLIRELLPALSDTAKVIIVYDGKFGDAEKLVWEDLELKEHFSLGRAANHCMAMCDGMVQWWAARQGDGADSEGMKRHFVHAWPGGVDTGLLRELPGYLQPVVKGLGGLLLTSPGVCAERLLNGVDGCALVGEQEGRFWSNIDNKGRLIAKKTVWSEERMNKVAEHTWGLIDRALTVQC